MSKDNKSTSKSTNKNNRHVRLISRLPYSKGVAFDENFQIPNWQKFFAKHYEWANKHPRTTDFLSWFSVDYESIGGKWFYLWTVLTLVGAGLWIGCWFLGLLTPATMPLDRKLNWLSGFGNKLMWICAVLWAINWILNWIWPFIANAFSNQEDDDADEEAHKKKSAKDFFGDRHTKSSKKSSSSSSSKAKSATASKSSSSSKAKSSSSSKTSSSSSSKKKSSSSSKKPNSSSSSKKSSSGSGSKTSSGSKKPSSSKPAPKKKVPAKA